MSKLNSHFRFTKTQRSGIFLLVIIIAIAQGVYFLFDRPTKSEIIDSELLIAFQNELDSLKKVEIEKNKPQIFPFNPNYITDYKGYTLGMSSIEIDRLLNYRSQNKWINSSNQFQDVTKVSDSLLNSISPYFKFPDWVINNSPRKVAFYTNTNRIKSFEEKVDLNKATAKQLQIVNGIGEKLSDRIIKFRNNFSGGFIADIQLLDVYGLSPEVIERITNNFTVKSPKSIERLNLNKVSVDQLVTIQHIDYELAYEIVDQRTLREGFKSIEELIKVKDFPITKFEIIKLYLTLE